MRLPLIDVVPRARRMLSRPALLNTAIAISVLAGLVEGAALAALLPTVTALAQDRAVWGLGLGGWLWVLAVLSAASFVVIYVANRRHYDAALDFLRSIHRLIGDRVARQPLGWFSRPLAGSLSRTVSTELMSAGEILAHMISPLVSRSVAAGVIIIAAWFWDPLLGLVLTVAVPMFVVCTLASTALLRRGRSLHEPEEVRLANRIVEYAQCQGALRACGRSDDFPPLTTALESTRATKTRALWLETAGMVLSGMLGQAVVVVLITVSGFLAVDGTLKPVAALAFIGLALRFTSTVSAISESAMSLESRRPLLDSLDEVLTARPLDEPKAPAGLPAPATVTLEDVTFRYSDGADPALRGVSLDVPAGSMVALVGPSGSGKTTVAKLISRFYDVDSGRVLVGGRDVAEQTTEQLMGQLSMVFQDTYLFDDSLLKNVQVGRADADPAEVRAAADLAGVTEIAERLPDGWDSRVGEGGRALSGGERQRVAVARALLKDAPIVLLDEATSALDVENESHIVAAIAKLRERATVVIIAHRLDTIAHADRIVLLDSTGAIEAQGSHDELVASGGTYARFWHRLRDAQGWQLTN
ncbi:ABC transporter ATP-binding protein [Tsukamurella sp. 8F]|uniref:ABC transporter ATP-binding protein n=1 Tax=unclassified Tsukamurella TaxID=2633480 RepID=UPI0023B95C61|nr:MULTISPECIES: ABC transporter ATP-binding protein [unclassified Tsukamurella]MDF0531904.1 ABC transporter ATP-binding protein [Tsukamurella sp. 8J]MDF0586956.1 ABC transporter ATP-binding protein [Tsukamurella sp. 8F]